jgi:hypothetical protein
MAVILSKFTYFIGLNTPGYAHTSDVPRDPGLKLAAFSLYPRRAMPREF